MPLKAIIHRLSDPIRAAHWWKYKAAHLLGFTYFYFYLLQWPLKESVIVLILSATTIIGIAGLGYVINDLYDIEPDRIAGKRNRMERFSNPVRVLIVVALTMVALLPWLYLKSNTWIWLLMASEILLFGLYAHPYIRLKERSWWGPVCDALYGHAVPVVIACLTYQQYLDVVPYPVVPFFITLFIWQFFKGMRNIFLHQMEDYEGDITAGLSTLTTLKGQQFIYRLIIRIILPLEGLSGMLLVFMIFNQVPFIGSGLAFFFLFYVLGHGLFRSTQTGPDHFRQNTYLYFLNDWYEDYFPWVFLIAMTLCRWDYTILAVVHLVMFPETPGKIFKDLKESLKELFVFLKKAIYPLYKNIR